MEYLFMGFAMGFLVSWLGLMLIWDIGLSFKRIGLAFAGYMLVGVLLAAYSSQRTCFGEPSSCVVRAGTLWPFDLIWAGAKFVTMPRDLHLPSIKWD